MEIRALFIPVGFPGSTQAKIRSVFVRVILGNPLAWETLDKVSKRGAATEPS